MSLATLSFSKALMRTAKIAAASAVRDAKFDDIVEKLAKKLITRSTRESALVAYEIE
jgi:hypothetical protein